jgi:hypothetical protein
MADPQQTLSLIVAILIFSAASVVLARSVRTATPVRSLAIVVWLLSGLGVYSTSTFLWAADVSDWFLVLTRLATVSARTIILILLVGVVEYTRRRH